MITSDNHCYGCNQTRDQMCGLFNRIETRIVTVLSERVTLLGHYWLALLTIESHRSWATASSSREDCHGSVNRNPAPCIGCDMPRRARIEINASKIVTRSSLVNLLEAMDRNSRSRILYPLGPIASEQRIHKNTAVFRCAPGLESSKGQGMGLGIHIAAV